MIVHKTLWIISIRKKMCIHLYSSEEKKEIKLVQRRWKTDKKDSAKKLKLHKIWANMIAMPVLDWYKWEKAQLLRIEYTDLKFSIHVFAAKCACFFVCKMLCQAVDDCAFNSNDIKSYYSAKACWLLLKSQRVSKRKWLGWMRKRHSTTRICECSKHSVRFVSYLFGRFVSILNIT